MSITNTVYPAAKHPAYNPVEWVFTSTNSAQPNFQIKLSVKNSGGTVIAILYAEPDGSSNINFDVSKVLQSQLSGTILPLTTSPGCISNNTESFFQYTLYAVETYLSGGVMIEGSTLTITTIGGASIFSYNMAKQSNETFADYICQDSDTGLFLVSFPADYKVKDHQYLQIPFITNEASGGALLTLYLLAGGSSTYGYTGVTFTGGRAIVVINPTYLALSNYFTLIARDDALNTISETLTVYVDHKTACSDNTQLLFKNHFGGYDTYSFPKRKKINKVESSDYKTNSTLNRWNVEADEVWELEGNPEVNNVLTWLRDLYNSKDVWYANGTTLEKVVVVNGSYVLEDTGLAKPVLTIRVQSKILN
jgi:hypothetical protein